MHQRLRHIVFSCITSLLIGVTFIVSCASLMGLIESPTQSYLEGRLYQKPPVLTADSLSSKTFQDETNQYFADKVPFRNNVLLANASLQRFQIGFANTLFRYPAYPTFFDSFYIYAPAYGVVVESPSVTKNESKEVLGKSVEAFGGFIDDNPQVNWVFALVDRSRISLASPAHSLVVSPADYPYYSENFLRKLPQTCSIVELSYDDPQSYFKDFFKSDHHWQISGALKAYDAICKELGRTPVRHDNLTIGFPGPFYGSESRNGLFTGVFDFVEDVEFTPGNYNVIVDGEEKSLEFLCYAYGKTDTPYTLKNEYESAYGHYFHGDYGLIEIHNADAPAGSLLIIGDSFTDNVDRFFAENYKDVYIIDPRHYKGGFKAFFEGHDVDDAFFLMASNTVITSSVQEALKS